MVMLSSGNELFAPFSPHIKVRPDAGFRQQSLKFTRLSPPSLIGESSFGLLLIEISSPLLGSGGASSRWRLLRRRFWRGLGRNVFRGNRSPLDPASAQKDEKEQSGQAITSPCRPLPFSCGASGHLGPPMKTRKGSPRGGRQRRPPARSR